MCRCLGCCEASEVYLPTPSTLQRIETEPADRERTLPETRVGISHGEPLADSEAKIVEAYGLEPYEVYSPTEHMSFCTECRAHEGIHVWVDTCIPEVIPAGRGDATPIWEAALGTKGELVVTNFAECLPLIRFRTGELIRVEGVDRCACGRTHPRMSRVSKACNTSVEQR